MGELRGRWFIPVVVGGIALAASIIILVALFGIPGAAADSGTPMVCENDSISGNSSRFGRIVDDIALVSMSRSPVMLHDLAGERFTVVIFCSYQCPCSDGYADRLRDLQTRYAASGISFLAIHSSANETMDGMQRYIQRKKYPLPVFRDAQGAAADAMGAAVTPEAFVFDSLWRLKYHGRIDDDKGGLHVKHHTLSAVLDTLKKGIPLLTKEHPALGCAIARSGDVASR